MAMKQRFAVQHDDVFPQGAFLKGEVEPVLDFQAGKRADGSMPQQLDKDTGLPVWQVVILDADDTAGKKDTAITVKFAAKHQPAPPANDTPFPWTPVEFVGLTALPYVEYTGGKNKEGQDRTRITWSYRAESMVKPGENPARKPAASGASASTKAAA